MTSFEIKADTHTPANPELSHNRTIEIAEIDALYDALDTGCLRRNDIVIICSRCAREMDLIEAVSNMPFRSMLVHLSSLAAETTELLENLLDFVVDMSGLKTHPRATLDIMIEQLTQAGNKVLLLNLAEQDGLRV